MAKGSQYTDVYLRENHKRGFGKGLTVNSFLGYRLLRGRAKNWSGRYANTLTSDLERRVRKGEVLRGDSVGKSTAYYPLDAPQKVVLAFGGNPFPEETELT